MIPDDDQMHYTQAELGLTDDQWLRYKLLYTVEWTPELEAFIRDRWRERGETMWVMTEAEADWIKAGH